MSPSDHILSRFPPWTLPTTRLALAFDAYSPPLYTLQLQGLLCLLQHNYNTNKS